MKAAGVPLHSLHVHTVWYLVPVGHSLQQWRSYALRIVHMKFAVNCLCGAGLHQLRGPVFVLSLWLSLVVLPSNQA